MFDIPVIDFYLEDDVVSIFLPEINWERYYG